MSQVLSVMQDEFLDYMRGKFDVMDYVVGKNFNFGKGNKDDFEIMKKYGQLTVVDLLRYKNQIVSSTLISLLLEEGKVEDIPKILGFNYLYFGEIEGGKSRGRDLGFPTANISLKKQKIMIYRYTDVICPFKKTFENL